MSSPSCINTVPNVKLQAETFQSDIYPPAPSGRPGLTSSEWFGGKDSNVLLFDLEQLYSPDGAAADVSIAKTFNPVAPVETRVVASSPPPVENPVRSPSPVRQDSSPQKSETQACKPPSPVQSDPPKVEKPVVERKVTPPAPPTQVCVYPS